MYFGAQAGTKNKPILSCLSLWDGAIVYISNARLQFFLNPILPQHKIVSAVWKHHNSIAASVSAAKITLR